MSVVRVNYCVPKPLKQRMEKVTGVNWSRLLSDYIRRYLDTRIGGGLPPPLEETCEEFGIVSG